MKSETKITQVLALDTHKLSDADLHAFVVTVTDLCNSRKLTNAGSETLIQFLHDVEAEFFTRKSDTATDALRKLTCLASDVIEEHYSYGPALVADANNILAGLEGAA